MAKHLTGTHQKKTGRLHLDKRAEAIIHAAPPEANDDDLLTSGEVANWFGVSKQWLEIGRVKNYGPPFQKLAPQVVRYRRSDVLAWLKQREYTCTGEYSPDVRGRAGRQKKVEA